MARYMIFTPAYVGGRYHDASPARPKAIELPDNKEPSRKWEPLDKPAQAALQRLAEADLERLPEEERKKLSQKEIQRRTAPKAIKVEHDLAPKELHGRPGFPGANPSVPPRSPADIPGNNANPGRPSDKPPV